MEFSTQTISVVQQRIARDKLRTALQAPISSEKYCVMYMVNGRQRRSPWFYRQSRAMQGLNMMRAKYGEKNAILYLD